MMVIRLDLKIICVTNIVVYNYNNGKKEKGKFIFHIGVKFICTNLSGELGAGWNNRHRRWERVPESDYFNVYIVVGILFHISGHVTVTFLLLICILNVL